MSFINLSRDTISQFFNYLFALACQCTTYELYRSRRILIGATPCKLYKQRDLPPVGRGSLCLRKIPFTTNTVVILDILIK